ncbi:hypothetical protein B0H63DRAFT_446884 [Podospora didyma]|uniref:Uncharacterized protein n=1 Tax=Podospora didyma TaxID=330526 RepID=A0AAE0U4Y9_9PEZI|nr:hypothetical protein B0H63DRAFT_446884 [Podospora didyma]
MVVMSRQQSRDLELNGRAFNKLAKSIQLHYKYVKIQHGIHCKTSAGLCLPNGVSPIDVLLKAVTRTIRIVPRKPTLSEEKHDGGKNLIYSSDEMPCREPVNWPYSPPCRRAILAGNAMLVPLWEGAPLERAPLSAEHLLGLSLWGAQSTFYGLRACIAAYSVAGLLSALSAELALRIELLCCPWLSMSTPECDAPVHCTLHDTLNAGQGAVISAEHLLRAPRLQCRKVRASTEVSAFRRQGLWLCVSPRRTFATNFPPVKLPSWPNKPCRRNYALAAIDPSPYDIRRYSPSFRALSPLAGVSQYPGQCTQAGDSGRKKSSHSTARLEDAVNHHGLNGSRRCLVTGSRPKLLVKNSIFSTSDGTVASQGRPAQRRSRNSRAGRMCPPSAVFLSSLWRAWSSVRTKVLRPPPIITVVGVPGVAYPRGMLDIEGKAAAVRSLCARTLTLLVMLAPGRLRASELSVSPCTSPRGLRQTHQEKARAAAFLSTGRTRLLLKLSGLVISKSSV